MLILDKLFGNKVYIKNERIISKNIITIESSMHNQTWINWGVLTITNFSVKEQIGTKFSFSNNEITIPAKTKCKISASFSADQISTGSELNMDVGGFQVFGASANAGGGNYFVNLTLPPMLYEAGITPAKIMMLIQSGSGEELRIRSAYITVEEV